MKNFFIGGIEIGEGCKPFIIAEMSGNHNASLEKALAIVDKAAECGAHAIKLQTYTPDTMTINHSGGLFLLMIQNLSGMVEIYMSCIKKRIHLGTGIMKFLKEQRERNYSI